MSIVSSLLAGGAGNLIDSVSNAVDKFVTTDKERMEQQIEREKTEMDHEYRMSQLDQQLALGQIEVNKAEASNPSLFVAGWRPFIGWIGGIAMAYQFLGYPLLTWLWALLQAKDILPTSVGAPQPLQADQLWVIITGMLGIGGMRSFEKYKGVDTRAVGNK